MAEGQTAKPQIVMGLAGYDHQNEVWRPIAVNEKGELMLTIGMADLISAQPPKITMAAPVSKTVNGTASVLLAANPDRLFALFVNTSQSKEVTMRVGGAPTAGVGIPLISKGGSYTLNGANLDTGEVQGINNGSGSATVIVIEGVAA